ncbi:MAG: TetR/AcrR family transcriptional regulator [Polyangia bacterium]|jgi:AcrR family transcriptional regulator
MPLPHYKPVNLDNQTVQRILDAALACWTRDGYHGASLKEIADEAKVAKSLLHYHFASKEHLLIELQAVHSRRVAAEVRRRLSTVTPSVATALGALDQVWDAIVATRDQLPFALEVWRASLQNRAVRARLEAFEAELFSLLREGIELGLGPLAGRLSLPPPRLAALLQVALDGFSLRLFLDPDVRRLRRTFDDFKMLIALALEPAPTTPKRRRPA